MVTAYTDGAVTLRSNRLRNGGYHEATDMSGMQGVHKGDFVVHGLDILRGSVGISDSTGAISSVCVLCEPMAQADPRYFVWVIRAQAFSGFPRALARGVREGGADFRRWDTLAELPVPAPPISVQTAIADYLDTETARIDALISKKQRMIELIEARIESLAGAILDPLVSIYGEVPLKAVAHLRVSNVDKKTKNDESAVLLCNYTDVYYNPRIDASLEFMKASADTKQIERLTIKSGDVLITKDSETADDIAVPTLVVQDLPGVVLGYHLAMLRPFAIDSLFLYWSIRSRRCRDAFALAASGVTRFGLRQDAIGRILVPAAPVSEQRSVAEKIETEVARGREVAKRLVSQIALLAERRQALITEAVTGKLDIQEVAA